MCGCKNINMLVGISQIRFHNVHYPWWPNVALIFLHIFCLLCVISASRFICEYSRVNAYFCCVRFSSVTTMFRDLLERTVQNDVFQCQVGCNKLNHSHTRPFNGPLSGTTWVSRYQKGKTNLWRQLGHMQVCTSLQTDNHASTPPLSFLQAICSCAFINKLNQSPLPLVLWHCWLGGRKGIRSVKNWVVGCWHGYLSGARCRLACGPADATDWFYLSGTGLPR